MTKYVILCYNFIKLTGQYKIELTSQSKGGEKMPKEEKTLDLERLLTIGIGALTVAREELKGLLEEFEKKGESRKKDAKKYIEDLIKKGEKEREELKKTIDERISELTKKIGIVTKSDLERITEKLEKLEKKMKK